MGWGRLGELRSAVSVPNPLRAAWDLLAPSGWRLAVTAAQTREEDGGDREGGAHGWREVVGWCEPKVSFGGERAGPGLRARPVTEAAQSSPCLLLVV